MIRSLIIILVLLFINNCGFKPIHQITETDSNFSNYTVEVQNSVSREIIDELNTSFTTDGEINYKDVILVNEDLNPLIINTNGTVAKYRIENNDGSHPQFKKLDALSKNLYEIFDIALIHFEYL